MLPLSNFLLVVWSWWVPVWLSSTYAPGETPIYSPSGGDIRGNLWILINVINRAVFLQSLVYLISVDRCAYLVLVILRNYLPLFLIYTLLCGTPFSRHFRIGPSDLFASTPSSLSSPFIVWCSIIVPRLLNRLRYLYVELATTYFYIGCIRFYYFPRQNYK